jgi:hypothetical protein
VRLDEQQQQDAKDSSHSSPVGTTLMIRRGCGWCACIQYGHALRMNEDGVVCAIALMYALFVFNQPRDWVDE